MKIDKQCELIVKNMGYECVFNDNNELIAIKDNNHMLLHDPNEYLGERKRKTFYDKKNDTSFYFIHEDLEVYPDINNYSCILSYYKEDGLNKFVIVNLTEEKPDTIITILFRNNKFPGRPYIQVLSGRCEIMNITQYDIYAEICGPSGNYKVINVENISTENYTNAIINYIKRFDRSSRWTKGVKDGLKIILPALTLCVNDFVNTWYDNLDKYQGVAQEVETKLEKDADDLRRQITQNKMYMKVLEQVKNSKEETIRRRK